MQAHVYYNTHMDTRTHTCINVNAASRCVYCVYVCTGKHYVYLDDIAASVRLHREAAQRLYMAPSLAFTSLQTTAEDYTRKFHTRVETLCLVDTCIAGLEKPMFFLRRSF